MHGLHQLGLLTLEVLLGSLDELLSFFIHFLHFLQAAVLNRLGSVGIFDHSLVFRYFLIHLLLELGIFIFILLGSFAEFDLNFIGLGHCREDFFS